MSRRAEDITRWADAIEAALPSIDACCVSKVLVYDKVSSTQDAAWRHRLPGKGVVVVSSVQTAGRGQRGRRWDDGFGLTLPVSFALSTAMDDVGLAARAGLAALDACCAAAPTADLRIKWPNDIVWRTNGLDRKLAGVLVERRDGVAVVGVGINVFRVDHDTVCARPPRAGCLEDIGGNTDRCRLAIGLVRSFSRWLGTPDDGVRMHWRERDAMVGTRRAFVCDGTDIEGEVLALDPLASIVVRTASGERSLAVATTRTADAVRADA
ncbi:MAG: biotin--[acetyl-CoA-carboxylase] ligase [Planctomycetota bacterium]|nr:MAG: biotin--[acetyl-CoA-carboxylase] ligase [Planctomycetota bacterium]